MITQKETLFLIKKIHLIFFAIFLLGFAIRIVGIYSISITPPEAEVLLSIAGRKPSTSYSFFYGAVYKTLHFLNIEGGTGLRFISVFLGSLFAVSPIFFIKEIGAKVAILSSLFIALDPFSVSNAIIFSGNTITLFFAVLLVDAIIHKRKSQYLIFFVFILCNGRGMGFFLIQLLLVIPTVILINSRLKINLNLHKYEDSTSLNLIIIVMFICWALLTKTPISNTFYDLSSFLLGWKNPYQNGNYPIVYFVSLLSYIPFAVIFPLIHFLVRKRFFIDKNINLCCIWIFFSLLVISFFPGHLIIDLVWVSVPLWIVTASAIIDHFSDSYTHDLETGTFLVVLSVFMISLALNLFTLIYQSIWGIGNSNTLISIITILILIILLSLYRAFTSTLKIAFNNLILVLVIFSGLFQVSITMRSIGINKKPVNEILWNGYFTDYDLFKNQVHQIANIVTGTSGRIKISTDFQTSPAVQWKINEENLSLINSQFPSSDPDILLTESINFSLYQSFFRRNEFISNQYPLWTWDPIKSINSPDFWNWFFFRNNQLYTEYNSLWINSMKMDVKSNAGED